MPSTIGSGESLKAVQTKSGALFATSTNGEPQFGLLPLAQGGTGTAFSSATSGDIVYYYKKDDSSTPQLWTKSKLDIAHGGTNGTTAAEARTNLGVNRIFSGTGTPGSTTGSTGDIYIRYTA